MIYVTLGAVGTTDMGAAPIAGDRTGTYLGYYLGYRVVFGESDLSLSLGPVINYLRPPCGGLAVFFGPLRCTPWMLVPILSNLCFNDLRVFSIIAFFAF